MKLKNRLVVAGVVAVALIGGGVFTGVAVASSKTTTYTACVASVGRTLYKVTVNGTPKCSGKDKTISWNQQGPAGTNGKNGAGGKNGTNGKNGKNGTNGASVLTSATTPTGTCTSGDTDIDLANGELYTCTAAAWHDTGTSIEGPMGPSNSFYSADSTAQNVQPTLSPVGSISLGAGTYVVDADVWLDDESPSNASDLAVCELTLGTATDEVEVGLLGPSGAPLNEGTASMTVAATIASAASATVSCVGAGNTGETLADSVNITAVQSASLTG